MQTQLKKEYIFLLLSCTLCCSHAFTCPSVSLKPLQIHGIHAKKLEQFRNNKNDNFNLYMSSSGKENRPRRKFPIPNPVAIVTNVFKATFRFQANFRKKFATLSRKGKLIVSFQLMVMGLLFGYTGTSITRSIAASRSGTAASSKPMEVPYSVFMDMVEKSGQGHTAGENPAMKVDHLIIGKEKIGFKVKSDAEKHALALKSTKLVETNDIAVQPVKERQLYTSKVNASPELVKFLRDNEIPFKAASTKGTNAAAMVARSSIILIYMLFLLRMYKTMAGGGSSKDTPGKLARQLQSDPKSMVKFEDIEGIDDAKFEVMELVDALKNPGKYAILGARAPTGLLLEGPPGTGKTMLARACAATAGVPLLYCSGSDFVEMFVGRGAARVRKTFERAGKTQFLDIVRTYEYSYHLTCLLTFS